MDFSDIFALLKSSPPPSFFQGNLVQLKEGENKAIHQVEKVILTSNGYFLDFGGDVYPNFPPGLLRTDFFNWFTYYSASSFSLIAPSLEEVKTEDLVWVLNNLYRPELKDRLVQLHRSRIFRLKSRLKNWLGSFF